VTEYIKEKTLLLHLQKLGCVDLQTRKYIGTTPFGGAVNLWKASNGSVFTLSDPHEYAQPGGEGLYEVNYVKDKINTISSLSGSIAVNARADEKQVEKPAFSVSRRSDDHGLSDYREDE
jgi:hypothetical protein